MSIAEKAIEIIQARYDTSEYRAGIDSIQEPSQKIYGAIDKLHSQQVLGWVDFLWEDAPEALRIAASGHDWDRAWEDERDRLEDIPHENGRPVAEEYDKHKQRHSENGARILARELSDFIPETMMDDISYLVLRHELGGEKDNQENNLPRPDKHTNSYDLNHAADVLQQADSLSFFDILDEYVNWRNPEKVVQKIAYMYQRIEDPKIKDRIRSMKFENPIAQELFDGVMESENTD